jgi:hypothetical protein
VRNAFPPTSWLTPKLSQREDLIIEAIYADLLTGRLDQLKSRFYIDSVTGRDVQKLDPLGHVLLRWSAVIEQQITHIDRSIAQIRSTESVPFLFAETPLIYSRSGTEKRSRRPPHPPRSASSSKTCKANSRRAEAAPTTAWARPAPRASPARRRATTAWAQRLKTDALPCSRWAGTTWTSMIRWKCRARAADGRRASGRGSKSVRLFDRTCTVA